MIIKNATLINMKDIYRKRMDLVIRDGKIAGVSSCAEGEEGEPVLDAGGAVVTPGFIEIHCLAGIRNQITRMDDNDADDADPVSPHLRAVDALDFSDEAFYMARQGGVTTAVCCPGSGELISGTCVTVKTGGNGFQSRIFAEESAYVFSLSAEPRQKFGKSGRMPQTRMGAAAGIRDILFRARAYRRREQAGMQGSFSLELHSLARVFDGMPVKFTAYRFHDIMTAVRIGEEFGLNYTVEGAYDALDVCRETGRKDIPFVLGPLFGKSASAEEKNRRLELAGDMEKEGIPFALSTWHPKVSLELFSCYLAMLGQRGMSEAEILKAATIRPAQLMGMDDRLGSLEYGKDADLLIWDGEPLDYYGRVRTMIIGGKIMEN